MLYPLVFNPIFKERVWGGRNLARLFGKRLPPGNPIGESWEISDRPGDVSVVVNGPLAGRDLRSLMEHHRAGLLGPARALHGRFPLLLKLLDAREKLSLQVHPPAEKAADLKGEPKTELWFIADAAPGAELYVGLRRGFNRSDFEQKIHDGTVADCFHRVPVKAGDAMFLPSGRVHAIGAGLVIFEIQQNSDTTYRVFDWNRLGLDGKPRELHLAESLASIDFDDLEPALVQSPFSEESGLQTRILVHDPLFDVSDTKGVGGGKWAMKPGQMQILACYQGTVQVRSAAEPVTLNPGGFCLVPAAAEGVSLHAKSDFGLLRTSAG